MIPVVLVQILVALAAHLLLPAYFILALWRRRQGESRHWLLTAMYTAAYLAYLFVAGRWDLFGYYWRYFWPVIFIVVAVRTYRDVRSKPLRIRGNAQAWSDFLVLAVFTGFLLFSLWGYRYSDEPVELDFPLGNGVYYIGQGGSTPLVNYHSSYPPQRYALDITALNAVGLRAGGLYPSELSRYVIYGEPVQSPCDGMVTVAVDGMPDHDPPASDPSNTSGNHVIIHCRGVNVLLAHLQQSSLTVSKGEQVATGQVLGRVGNSGNTTEPHLHIHAVRAEKPDTHKGQGVPILFDQRFPVRNAIFRLQPR